MMLRNRSRRANRRVSMLLAAAAIVAVGAVAFGLRVAHDEAISVDGIHFSADELAVAAERAERAGADPDAQSQAVDQLRDDLALFAVARQLGASDVERPSDILDLVDEVNAQRASAEASGAILYGPVRYDARSFYGKALTDIRQTALDHLQKQGETVTDAEVRARFERDRDQWAAAATTYQLSVATLAAGDDPLEDEAQMRALAAGEWGGIAAVAETAAVELGADELLAGAVSPDAAAAIAGSEDGEIVGPDNSGRAWILYRVDGRSVDEARAFAHYESRIRSSLYEEQLDHLIADSRAEQIIAP